MRRQLAAVALIGGTALLSAGVAEAAKSPSTDRNSTPTTMDRRVVEAQGRNGSDGHGTTTTTRPRKNNNGTTTTTTTEATGGGGGGGATVKGNELTRAQPATAVQGQARFTG